MEDRFHNQSGIVPPQLLERARYTIVGSGAIGSFLTMSLAKMGATVIETFDGDTIEEHNIATQFFPEYTVGQKKAEALLEMTRQFSGIEIKANARHWKPGDELGDVVISCVDSMAVRKALFVEAVKGKAKWIDGRMGAQVLRVYAIDTTKPEEVAFYERSLYTDAKAAPERCTQRSIIYTVFIVAGLMLNNVKKFITNSRYTPEQVFDATMDIHVPTRQVKKLEAVEV